MPEEVFVYIYIYSFFLALGVVKGIILSNSVIKCNFKVALILLDSEGGRVGEVKIWKTSGYLQQKHVDSLLRVEWLECACV